MPRRVPKKKVTAAEAVANILPPPAGATPDPAAVPTFTIKPKAEVLRKLVENPPPRPSLQAFLDHFFALRGGPAQFAMDLSAELDATEPGSLVHTQIIQLVMRSMQVADKKEGAMDELGLVTDADLDRLINQVGDRLHADATKPPESPKP